MLLPEILGDILVPMNCDHIDFEWTDPDDPQPADHWPLWIINSISPGQNGRHFANDIFKYIFMNEKSCLFIEVSLKFVLKGPIDNNPALV